MYQCAYSDPKSGCNEVLFRPFSTFFRPPLSPWPGAGGLGGLCHLVDQHAVEVKTRQLTLAASTGRFDGSHGGELLVWKSPLFPSQVRGE